MSRFFIALLPPPEVQRYVTQVKEYFRDTYQSQAALRSPPHITLQAPFEWPTADAEQLFMTLAQFRASTSTIPLCLSGFGAFPPRVIFLAVEHTPALITLQAELSQYVEDTLGIVDRRSRDRPFRPHLTVAFRDLKPAAFRRAWPEFEPQTVQFDFEVQALTLLRHTGHRWAVEKQVPLQ
jgi:2'-5' RNA ligase